MAAHVATTTHGTLPTGRVRIRIPLIAFVVLILVFAAHVPLGHAAHAACTWGEPPSHSCGQALVSFGYP